jgi:hypothetical protein
MTMSRQPTEMLKGTLEGVVLAERLQQLGRGGK